MICKGIALEGECLTGKSSVLREMALRWQHYPFLVIPEYFEIGELSNVSRRDKDDALRIQDELLVIERRRTSMALDFLATHDNGKVGWDRSFLSLLSYEYSMKMAGVIDGFEYLLERIFRLASDEDIILPSQIILLTAKSLTIESRRKAHMAQGHDDVSAQLKDIEIRSWQTEFTRATGKRLYCFGYNEIATDRLTIEKVVSRCVNYII